MSISSHLESLVPYGALAVRIQPVDGDPVDLMSEGGGLEEAFDALGQGPLLAVLRDAAIGSVMLADGELQVVVSREGTHAKLQVLWGADVVVEKAVELPSLAPAHTGPLFRPEGAAVCRQDAIHALDKPVYSVDEGGETRFYHRGVHGPGLGQLPLLGSVAPLGPHNLGSAGFKEQMGVRWAYLAGAMAGGISSADLVVAMSNAGLLGFFGSGGLPVPAIEAALRDIAARAQGVWGANLLHNPVEPKVEEDTVDLYLDHGVQFISASAYMGLSPAVVRFRYHGIHRDDKGKIVCPNQVFAKISRAEVAEKFLAPPPNAVLEQLVERGCFTREQLELATKVPVASALTAEADSGGHTDHRALTVLLPEILQLRDEARRVHGTHVFVGAAGGLGTPEAVWGAFAMGADYVLTGSVNQATVEAGTSDEVKKMLAAAGPADVASGPAPDMFEMGAKVQVLSRGSMYAQRSAKLYDIYRSIGNLDAIPEQERQRIEKRIFRRPLAEVWDGTKAYWLERDPAQVEKAEREPSYKMALTFRWYLGMTSRWARIGENTRKRDFQIWCGPAMGGFNRWAAGGPLEKVTERTVVKIADALMTGAAAACRSARL